MQSDTLSLIIHAAVDTSADYFNYILVDKQWRAAAKAAFWPDPRQILGNAINLLVRALLRLHAKTPLTLKQRLYLAPLVCMHSANMASLRLLSTIHDYTATPEYLRDSELPGQEVLEFFAYNHNIVRVMLEKNVAAPADVIAVVCKKWNGVAKIRTIAPFTDDMMRDYPDYARNVLTTTNNSYKIAPGTVVWNQLINSEHYHNMMATLIAIGRDVSLLASARPVIDTGNPDESIDRPESVHLNANLEYRNYSVGNGILSASLVDWMPDGFMLRRKSVFSVVNDIDCGIDRDAAMERVLRIPLDTVRPHG